MPTQLKNQLNDIDLQKHLNYAAKSNDSNKKQGIISTNDNHHIETSKSAKRKRSLSRDRTTTNAPVPLMQLNLENAQQSKRLRIQQQTQQEINFTENQTDYSANDYIDFDLTSEPIVNGLTLNQFIQTLNS